MTINIYISLNQDDFTALFLSKLSIVQYHEKQSDTNSNSQMNFACFIDAHIYKSTFFVVL